MPHFFLKLIAPRQSFAMDMNEDEKKLMQQHALYWKSRQDKGEVVVFGPVLDANQPYGMGIVTAADNAGARAFADADPVIKAGLGFRCEISPMRAITRDTPLT
jgi:uncharacterized protein YciI